MKAPKAFSLIKYITFLDLKTVFYPRTFLSQQSHSGSKRDERKNRAIRKLICHSCEPIFITTHCKGLSAFLGWSDTVVVDTAWNKQTINRGLEIVPLQKKNFFYFNSIWHIIPDLFPDHDPSKRKWIDFFFLFKAWKLLKSFQGEKK